MTDSRSIDRDSRRIIRQELLTNILVEAGAGSGKTQMLADRMAAGVASGVYQVEHLAAVTFTRKAASELRGRFHLALEHRLEHAAAEEAARVRAALSNLERFFAGTIHSFCARLLRERPVESGVSPGFTELDEVQDLELRKRVWRDFITRARSAGCPVMLDLLDAGVKPGDLDAAFSTICVNDDVEFPPGDGACPDVEAARKGLDAFWKELQKHLPATIAADTKCPIQKAAVQYRSRLRVERTRLDRPATVAALLEIWKCKSEITQNRWASSAAERRRLRDLINPLHAEFRQQVVDRYLAQWRQYVYRLAVTLLTRARAHAAAERRRQNTLNYGDLLTLTAKVLRDNLSVRRALQRKYRHLFVDEFQDTDPVQAEVVFLLAADEQDASHDWRRLSLRPGALFVVGDPKQSIYRFRRADIEIYNAVRDRFSDPKVGRVVPLTMNFRSVPALCEWANTVFAAQFPATPTVHSPQFARLDPHEDENEAKSKRPSGLFTLTHGGEASDVAALDAAAIARYIRSEVDAGRRKYSDFLILTRKKKARIAPYASALEELNVPIEVSGAGAFGESVEVEALTVLLRALADPQDQLTLVNVLRGPLFGLSDGELFDFKQAGGWFSIFEPTAAAGRGFRPAGAAGRVLNALAALHQYYRWTRILPGGAALDKILEHTGYLALASTTPGGVDAGDLLHANARVRKVLKNDGNLADAADALAADSEASNEVESLPLEPGRTDVVRLMNLHKAKGLEADVVFLADPCGGMGKWIDVHIKRDGEQALGWFKVEKKSEGSYAPKLLGEHADWEQHEATEEPYLDAEENRLLYVAATRARELLVISRYSGKARSAAWGVLNQHLDTAKELPVPANVKVASSEPAPCSEALRAAAVVAREAADGHVNTASWLITSVTAEAKHIATMTAASEPALADDATRVVLQDTSSHRADAGLAWGTLIHGLLEHAMRHTGFSREDLRRLGMWLTVENPQLRPVLDVALDTVQRVSQAAFWTQAQSAERSVETPFTVSLEPGAMLNGVIDLAYATRSVWSVIDYKSDVGLSNSVPQAYQQQLAQYQSALEACGLAV